MNEILKLYGLDNSDTEILLLSSGLINSTWRINDKEQSFILQRINNSVFLTPENIDFNINIICRYLEESNPSYIHLKLVPCIDGRSLIQDSTGNYFRMFPYLNGITFSVLDDASLAFEAAKKFGEYTRVLKGVPISDIGVTLPNFHNLTLRVEQYQQSLLVASAERRSSASRAIDWIASFDFTNSLYEQSIRDIKVRITHHDTKISNVLFDHNSKGLCVIDLDTVMPGYYISDLGDMFRTYLSPASEEETDLTKVYVRMDYFTAIVRGYLSELLEELSQAERKYIVFAGQFMIYMQALRFLTDYLNNDVYYGAKYEGHNLNRALNQLTLLQSFMDHESEMRSLLTQEFGIEIQKSVKSI